MTAAEQSAEFEKVARKHGADGDDRSFAEALRELYKTTQSDALLQLSTIYASYIRDGDDAASKALVTRALPAVNNRLAALKKL